MGKEDIEVAEAPIPSSEKDGAVVGVRAVGISSDVPQKYRGQPSHV